MVWCFPSLFYRNLWLGLLSITLRLMCAAPATQVLHSEKYLIISFSYKLVDSTKNTRWLRVSMCCIAYIGYEHRSSKTCYMLNWEMTWGDHPSQTHWPTWESFLISHHDLMLINQLCFHNNTERCWSLVQTCRFPSAGASISAWRCAATAACGNASREEGNSQLILKWIQELSGFA